VPPAHPDHRAKSVAPASEWQRVRQTVDPHGYKGPTHLGVQKVQRHNHEVIEREFLGEREIETVLQPSSAT